ncbi:MAG: sigma-54 dependent transcriptional regulator [Victivallaceae bacterium]|nr:sigma-54 dependent transcriptional regulator [Victivallaceae bacterium]
MANDKAKILIVDDEYNTREALARFFRRRFDVETAPDGLSAIEKLHADLYDLVLTDLRMPGADGMQVLSAADEAGTPAIVLTAYGSIGDAVKAVKLGAFDFVSKPVKLDVLDRMVSAALEQRRPEKEVSSSSVPDEKKEGVLSALPDVVAPCGAADPMSKVFETAKAVAPSRASVLLSGESGTGKEVVARLIHAASGRSGAFVPVHCAALTSTILESELFGYEKGAFTGASERRIGKFEQAHGGTLFLDEIGEIDAATQVKLLRVLETRSFERVGGVETVHSDFRLVAATNRDLRAMVEEGSFREDLYYRLSVIELELPPLRARRMAIGDLLDHFSAFFAAENGRPKPEFTPEARELLVGADWPGNIRELRNCVESMVVLSPDGKLGADAIPKSVLAGGLSRGSATKTPSLDLRETEDSLIEKALAECNGNRTRAAEKLGISRRTLLRRLAEKK